MIKITEKYYINANTNCYILQEKTTVQDKNSKNYGKKVFKDLGYYTTIESILKGILKTELRNYISKSEENSINDLVKQIRNLETYLKNLKLDI
jgi:hypothetical protein